MKVNLLICFALAAWLGSLTALHAQSTNAAPAAPSVREQLQNLVDQVQTKAQTGKRSETDLADELKGLDSLIAAQQGATTDLAAQIVYMKAMLYLQVIKDNVKGAEIMAQIATNYPQTEYGANAAGLLPDLSRMANAQKIRDSLVVGTIFPDFSVTNLTGGNLSVRAFKGKVVLLDFWATWCVPCRIELPNVIAAYQKYHSDGFEVIGINLDSDRSLVDAFLKEQSGMVWPQYYDGLGWTNKLVLKYGVSSIPATFLIGPNGKIIAKDMHGEALGDAVAEAMAMK